MGTIAGLIKGDARSLDYSSSHALRKCQMLSPEPHG